MSELAPRFNFQEIEEKWCRYWEESGIVHGSAHAHKRPYSMVIPPPNVTGILHMGHALNNTLQDILIRYQRMNGHETCWMPGTDHAGIATQNVVEKQLAKEGKTRQQIGREELLKRLWDWKQQYGDTIITQLKRLGASCDWPRTRFTMDEEYSHAVRYVFVELYRKGLIYRGQYIINWCPRCQTALSDEEAEHREQQGALYHIRYPRQDQKGYVVVATTRPETMLGDTAVAVNPTDERYRGLIDTMLVLPIVGREIKVIADDHVDAAFGTGAVKVTPAHDPNDFAMAQRHQLEFINVMHPDGRINEQGGEFNGMDRFEAREAIVAELKKLKLLDKVEPHQHAVGHCYRCHTVVEPYLSRQWFVRMKPLAQPALQAVVDGKIKFHPDRWTKVYVNWMEGIRDWCISRQIWWGHRIPVWYCTAKGLPQCQEPIVAMTAPQRCPHCESLSLAQDEDVLDTWFSSWLWPFATFGWPKMTADVKYFYPTTALFTASEIIFFWVARMIMAGYEFMGEAPFRDVYIHGTVRDAQGRKMSKSLGNAIDPLEIIREYGADALRFSLIMNSGQDLFISKEKFETGRNFANKIWNATRLVLMNVPAQHRRLNLDQEIDLQRSDFTSRWILSRLATTVEQIDLALAQYRFSEAENLVYEFFWGNFCDWYLELSKQKFSSEEVQKVSFFIVEQSLRILHPFLPFVTEEIWEHLGFENGCLAVQAWPKVIRHHHDTTVEQGMNNIIELITAIRNVKTQWNIKPQQEIDCFLSAAEATDLAVLTHNEDTLKYLLKLRNLTICPQYQTPKGSVAGVVGLIKFCIPLEGIIDLDAEKQKIAREIETYKKAVMGITQRLANEDFTRKAPAEVVMKEQERVNTLRAKIHELESVIRNMG